MTGRGSAKVITEQRLPAVKRFVDRF